MHEQSTVPRKRRKMHLYAHSVEDQPEAEWEALSHHLAAVGRRAAEFAAAFGGAEMARAMGILHDIGGCSAAYQTYIRSPVADGGAKGPDHSTAGAREAQMLLASLERRGSSDRAFWNKQTQRPVAEIHGFWAEVRIEANLPGVRLHDLRHSFASHAAARSETLQMIGKLLGHSRLQTTSRYAHLDDGPVLEAAGRIGSLIADAMGADNPLLKG